jgi:hypothetical protein
MSELTILVAGTRRRVARVAKIELADDEQFDAGHE